MYDCCIDMPILLIDHVVHKKLMFMQLSLAWHGCAKLDVYAVAERVTTVLLNDLLVHASYKMQRIKNLTNFNVVN